MSSANRRSTPDKPPEETKRPAAGPENNSEMNALDAAAPRADFVAAEAAQEAEAFTEGAQARDMEKEPGWRDRVAQWRAERRSQRERRELEELPDRPVDGPEEVADEDWKAETVDAWQGQGPDGAEENAAVLPHVQGKEETLSAVEKAAAAAGPAAENDEAEMPRPADEVGQGKEGEARLAEAIEKAPLPEQQARKKLRRRREWRRVLPAVLVTLLYAVLAFLMFRNAADARRQGVSLSLRYDVPLSTEAVHNAKYILRNPDLVSEYSPAFWYESDAEHMTSLRGTVETPVLFVDGDMATVYHVEFLHGTYPSTLEADGLAVSEDLAWELFGGVNVVGAEIEWYGVTYTVRGVFKGATPLALAQVDAQTAPMPGFSGVELLGSTTEGDPRDAAKEFAKQLGLGEPDVIVGASVVPELLQMMAWLPAVVLIVWFVFRMMGLLRHVAYWKKQLVWFGLLLAIALAVPRLLDMLPPWVIPNQWSNFDHWSAFYKEMTLRLEQWLGLYPFAGDIQGKKQLIWQVILLVPALFAMVSMIRRWSVYMRRREAALLLGVHRMREAKVPKDMPLELVLEMDTAREEAGREAQEEALEEHDDILELKGERDRLKKRNPMS